MLGEVPRRELRRWQLRLWQTPSPSTDWFCRVIVVAVVRDVSEVASDAIIPARRCRATSRKNLDTDSACYSSQWATLRQCESLEALASPRVSSYSYSHVRMSFVTVMDIVASDHLAFDFDDLLVSQQQVATLFGRQSRLRF